MSNHLDCSSFWRFSLKQKVSFATLGLLKNRRDRRPYGFQRIFCFPLGWNLGILIPPKDPSNRTMGSSMRHESHRHGGPKMGGWSFKESEEGIAKTILFAPRERKTGDIRLPDSKRTPKSTLILKVIPRSRSSRSYLEVPRSKFLYSIKNKESIEIIF